MGLCGSERLLSSNEGVSGLARSILCVPQDHAGVREMADPRSGKRTGKVPSAEGRMARALEGILDDLERDLDTLADRMLERYLVAIPAYRSLPDETLRQVREVNRKNLVGFVRSLRYRTLPDGDELQWISDSASLRAREGVPLSALLAAYRTGAHVVWAEAMRRIGDDPDRLRAGLDLATGVMQWIDLASGAAAQAYLSEYERLASDRESARRDFLEGVLSGALAAEEILARAEALGLDVGVSHAVVTIGAAAGAEVGFREAWHRLKTMIADLPDADTSVVVPRGCDIVVVFPTGGGRLEAMHSSLAAVVERASGALGLDLRAGVGRPRETVAELAGSYREAWIALAAARTAQGRRAVAYGEVMIEELLLRERGVARRLAQAVLDPLESHPDLRHTLIEFIAKGPSLPAVARALFLHPNTVAYRLARVKELTGRDPKSPAGMAELFLALRAADLVGKVSD